MENVVPAEQLLGLTLNEEWLVKERVVRAPSATGGCFSQGYLVESRHTGRAGYLKALDLTKAFSDGNPMIALQWMTNAYEFERQVCDKCAGRRLDRVVAALDAGSIKTDANNPFSLVPYLIFQLADGDIRTQMDAADEFDLAWVLRCLHQIANGLQQLHGIQVAHQDLKPSNVLVFEQDGSKLADLGRACVKGTIAPHEDTVPAGDPRYAPPEAMYNAVPPDWNPRRLGCDLYHLGSMIVFFFSRCSMTSLLVDQVNISQRPDNWAGTYDEILPYLRDAFGRAIERMAHDIPSEIRDELVIAVRQLCDPDPAKRGHPDSHRSGDKYALERYVSLFNLLASRVEYRIGRKR